MLTYMLFESLHPSWQQMLVEQKTALVSIEKALQQSTKLTPEPGAIMRAFAQPADQVKVLIIGQDPYPTLGVATGLAFEVKTGTPMPQSLRNLMRELSDDLPECTATGDLSRWANQGVMLLNSALTTEVGISGAHSKLWASFTQAVVRKLDALGGDRLVILALGNHAQALARLASMARVVSAAHPSPLSATRGFFGSRVFSKVNAELQRAQLEPIDWSC